MTRTLIALIALALFSPFACSKTEPAAPIKKAVGADDVPPTTERTSGDEDECSTDNSDAADSESTEGAEDDDSTSLSLLLATATYEDDVKSVIQRNCASCHGVDQFTLAAFTDLEPFKTKIVPKGSALSFQPVNPGHENRLSGMSSSDKQTLIDWAGADYAETAADLPESETEEPTDDEEEGSDDEKDSSSSDDDNCDTASASNNSDDEEIEFPKTLLSPAKLKECNDDGLVFDRESNAAKAEDDQSCTTYTLGDWCDTSGIKSEFGSSGKAVEAAIDDLEADDWVIDQCGEDGSKRFVYLYKKSIVGSEAKLKVKKLTPSN